MNYEEQALAIDKMTDLINKLNYYRDKYYNYNISEISDKEYDDMYDELVRLEKESGIQLQSSPTATVGYTVVSELKKVEHNHPMLSLDKTKSVKDVIQYFSPCTTDIMAKMDGLTCSLHYVNGYLVSAETRGDGYVGEDVTHNADIIDSIPKKIPCMLETVIDGEIITTYDNFEKINATLPDDKKYKHIRNYASGSIRQLNNKIAKERNLMFVAWRAVRGHYRLSFTEMMQFLRDNGFVTVPFIPNITLNETSVESSINLIRNICTQMKYPIDGCVFTFDDLIYGERLGETAHHRKDQLAFKFYDDKYDSTLINIEWTAGKTGVLTPTAVFNPVDIDGTTVSRASLHNISIIKALGLTNGCTVHVYKANQIIPQIDSCEIDGVDNIVIPSVCPVCGAKTRIDNENGSEVLMCTNPACAGKTLAKFINFVSRKCTNIVGLSEATISEFIDRGYIKCYKDIYHLRDYASEIASIEGFGQRSVTKLLESIETSRNIKLDNFIASLGIDGVGINTAKVLADTFDYDVNKFFNALENHFDFSIIDGFGGSSQANIYAWYRDYKNNPDSMANGIVEEFNFNNSAPVKTDTALSDMRFCITGTFSKPREELKALLESKGATFVSGVSKNLTVLFAGESAGGKLDKAKALGIHIADEKELMNYIGEETTKKETSDNSNQISLW